MAKKPESGDINVCIQVSSPGAVVGARADINTASEGHHHVQQLAWQKSRLWPAGKRLLVAFKPGSGSAKVRETVKRYAKWVESYGHFSLDFDYGGRYEDADIRINIDASGASWSYVGTDCRNAPRGKPTMNFGWFNDDTETSEFSRTTQHEFCHALGLVHEHQSPASRILWDKERVYKHYQEQGWEKSEVDYQILRRLPSDDHGCSSYDPHSIMAYCVPSGLTTDGSLRKMNCCLSETDKKSIRQLYPFPIRGEGRGRLEVLSPVAKGKHLEHPISFHPPYTIPPNVGLGIATLDVVNKPRVCFALSIKNLENDSANIQLKRMANTKLSKLVHTCVEVDRHDDSMQVGTCKINKNQVADSSWHTYSKFIKFERPFSNTPVVRVFLTGLHFDKGDIRACKCWVDMKKVTKKGFTAHFKAQSWGDSQSVELTFVAHLETKLGVKSGFVKAGDTTSEQSGRVKFRPEFAKEPRVLLAISGFEFHQQKSLRVSAKASEITKSGFKWNVHSWDECRLSSALVTWMCFGVDLRRAVPAGT